MKRILCLGGLLLSVAGAGGQMRAAPWDAAAFAPEGTTYEVVWRDTDETQWTHSQSAGRDMHLKLNVSKDNVLFGVRAVSAAGDRSLPVPPLPAR